MAGDLADQLAIAEVVANYSYTWDEKDLNSFADLFVEDCIWEMFPPGGSEPAVRVKDRDTLRAEAIEIHTGEGRLAGVQTRLVQTGLVFLEQSATSARTKSMAMLVAYYDADGPKIMTTGVYKDGWRKTDVGWKFAHRAFYVDGPLK